MDQFEFVDSLQTIHWNRDRERKSDSPTTDTEKTQMRAVLGSLSWLCNQTEFLFSSDVGFLIPSIPQNTISDIFTLNKLVDEVKRQPSKLRIHGLKFRENIDLVAWADAAWANRPDFINSTGGIVIGGVPQGLKHGDVTSVSLLNWRSYKIHRVSRSPACAETHAVVDAEDELFHLRYVVRISKPSFYTCGSEFFSNLGTDAWGPSDR